MNKMRLFLVTVIFLISLILGSCGIVASPTSTPIPPSTTAPTTSPTVLPSQELGLSSFSDAMAAVVAKIEPAVVFISVDYKTTSFFGGTTTATKTGSGVIMATDGYILTNNHVIDNYQTINVTLPNDPQNYEAKLVGADSTSDLAVIKIQGNNFPFAQFGNASGLKVGNWVIAVGNPEGLEGGPTVTEGVVSNLERSFTIDSSVYYDVIQTSAAINPGNSGGPLVNIKDARVVGINSFIISGAQGLGFAISSDTASKVYSELVTQGKVTRPYLGASLQTVTPDLVGQLHLSRNTGIVITSLDANGQASKAGLQINDVITAVNGQQVSTDTQLLKILWLQYKPGDQVKMTFWRGTQQQEVTATLAERPTTG